MTDRFTTGQIVKLKNGSTAAVQFVGQTGFAPGDWLGVAFAEPVGKNDGSVKGETYFECEPQHGMFIRPEMAELVQEESELKTQAAASNNKPAASASKGKPSTMANGTRRTSSLDPAASKRQGMNSFSPTPGARDKPVMNGRLVCFLGCKLATRVLMTAVSAKTPRSPYRFQLGFWPGFHSRSNIFRTHSIRSAQAVCGKIPT